MTSTETHEDERELIISRSGLLALSAAALEQQRTQASLESGDRPWTGARVVAALVPTAVAVGSPVVVADVVCVDHAGVRTARLWVGEQRAVLHPYGPADAAQAVVSVGLNLLPVLVARAVDLNPRPVSQKAAFSSTVPALIAACRSSNHPPPWPPGCASGDARLWRIDWGSSQGRQHSLAVLDLQAEGLWRPIDSSLEEVVWAPTDVSTVWSALARLFGAVMGDVLPSAV